MKLQELLKENVLNPYLRNAAGPGLSSTSPGLPGAVAGVKDALSKHRLIRSINADGNPVLGQMAWTSTDRTDEWTPALDNAIIAWKNSINTQTQDNTLDPSIPQLRANDIRYLIGMRMYPENHPKTGLLYLGTGESPDPQQADAGGGTLSGQTVDLTQKIDTDYLSITNTRDFVNAITYTGWRVILNELFRVKELNQSGFDEFIQRSMKLIFDSGNSNPRRWFDTYRTQIVGSAWKDEVATLANNTTIGFIPPGNSIPPLPDNAETVGDSRAGKQLADSGGLSQSLYLYFKPMAEGLIAKETALYNQQRSERAAANTADPAEAAQTISETDVNTWVSDMEEALRFDIIAILPGGRAPDDDVPSVQRLLNELQNAKDWEAVAAAYEQKTGNSLSADLADNLNDDNYDTIVRSRLIQLYVVRPHLMHGSIEFPLDKDFVEVEIDGVTYKVMKETDGNRIDVRQGSERVKDIVLVNEILKEAITKTGGTVPDFSIEPTQEDLQMAGAAIIEGIQSYAPEMVAFYTVQEPFNKSGLPRLGPVRLKGMLREAAIMIANGQSELGVVEWTQNVVKADAVWLIGDGSEDNPGVAFIHFDPRYASEGQQGRPGSFTTTDDDEVEVTDEIMDYISRLDSTDAEAQNALEEILNSDDPEKLYEDIYRAFPTNSQQGQFLDERLGSEQDLLEILERTGNEGLLRLAVGKIGAAVAAPRLMAKLFLQAQKGSNWTFGIGTDNELAADLIAQITGAPSPRRAYDLINERYRDLDGVNDDLIDDMAGEQFFGLIGGTYYNDLARAIGESGLDLRRNELPTSVTRRLEAVQEEPSVENLQSLERVIDKRNFESEEAVELVLEELNEVVLQFETTLDDDARELILSMKDELLEIGKELNEEFWDNRWYKRWGRTISSWFNS